MAEMREEAKTLREEMAEVMARPQQALLEAYEEQPGKKKGMLSKMIQNVRSSLAQSSI